MTESSTPPGIPSPARLAAWLNDHVPGGPLELTDIQLIAGGRSNLTYRLTVSQPRAEPGAGAESTRLLVLRRPPLGHVLPTAHDMSREFRVLSALAGTRVPVAPLVASCTDVEVIGAPFYVMEYVPGVVLRTRNDTKDLTEAQAAELSRHLAEMLAAIHGVDVNQVGLGDLGRGAGYLRRQLDRWQRQWELSVTEERPGYTQLVERLTAALPAETEGQTTLVHGDYRLDNALVMLNPRPRITAVVDWEMATLGDPLADLGLTLVYWTEDGEEGWLTPAGSPAGTRGVTADATASPGFWTRAEFAAEYARLTGRDVSRIGYYVAFGYFKLAVVLEGIHARYQQGKTVGEGFEQEGFAVPLLIARAHQVLDTQSST
ncbi:MAG TPA: phosphotransferase family protein [Streptosporangiaceae bacterium]|nr:phosphotransferase family protein [Streptosporangiaceae bacterium]